jgi:tetratricopeptide (TPR) repeat protein
MIGARIGRYELLRRLGAGAMGEVYLARDHSLGREVAIKFLPQSFASNPDRMARFATEARAASSLNHPNIVTIHEFGEIDGISYLVMEYIEGQTLRQALRDGPLKSRKVFDYAAQIADGLAKAHAAGIVHRDLKPENLMITREGFVKILDFGLAKLYRDDSGDSKQVSMSSSTASTATFLPTASGMIVGTVGYMSPEQASGQTADFRSDQFALGAILYEMATGRRAFQRATPVQTLTAIIEDEPEEHSFPAAARHVLKVCLIKDPERRYNSTADLASDLHNLRDRLSESGKTDVFRWWRIGGLLSPWRRLALALVAVLLLLMVTPARETLLELLHMLPIPAEKRIAVLPFRYTGSSNDDRMFCDGFLSYLTARLGQVERFQHSVWVVPATEVRDSGAISATTARRALGVKLALEGNLQRIEGDLVFTASLIDTDRLRQLRATTIRVVEGKTSLLVEAVDAVIQMLDLELSPEARSAFHGGGTDIVQASIAYGQALGYSAYQQARTKLERYEQEQNLEKAISLFNDALRRDPNYALAHAGLGEAYWRLSRFTHKSEQVALAEEHCRRALSLDATLAETWVTLGVLHAGTGKAEEGVQDLRRAIDRDPRNAAAYRELASAYRKLNREADAETAYRKAIVLEPSSWVARSYFGAYLLNRGRFAEAEQQYKDALALVPENARLWSGLGSAYYLEQKYPEAENAWRKSLELYPTSTAAANLALRPFFEGRYPEAALRLERAIKIDDRDYRVWRNLASAYYWSPGERQQAEKAFRKAAELAEKERSVDPSDPRVWVDLADCYAMLRQTAKAREAVAEASRLGGNQGQIARSIAEVYAQLKNRDLALTWISTALKLGVPKDEIVRSPAFEELRTDDRYQNLTGEGAAPRGSRR